MCRQRSLETAKSSRSIYWARCEPQRSGSRRFMTRKAGGCADKPMPIHERDPWRRQYFENIACPDTVFIPTDDADAYRWNPRHRGVYNKLLVAESQGLDCAPHGVEPTHYPVFSH